MGYLDIVMGNTQAPQEAVGDWSGTKADGGTGQWPQGGTEPGALSSEAMAKILGLFSGNETNRIALMNAQKPTFGAGAPNPGHVAASQVGSPEKVKLAGQQVVPSLAQILGIKG